MAFLGHGFIILYNVTCLNDMDEDCRKITLFKKIHISILKLQIFICSAKLHIHVVEGVVVVGNLGT